MKKMILNPYKVKSGNGMRGASCILSLTFIAALLLVNAAPLNAAQTNRQATNVSPLTAASDVKKKSNEREELEKSIAMLEEVYVNRSSRGLAYHPAALSNIGRLIDLSKGLLGRYVTEEQREFRDVLVQYFERKVSKEDLLKRQRMFKNEIDFIDQWSAVLLEQETVRQQQEYAYEAIQQAADKLEQKRIELLETQIKLGVKPNEK